MAEPMELQLRRRARKLKQYSQIEAARAGAWALNRTARYVNTRLVRAVAKATGIKSKNIRKKVYISKATPQKAVAKLHVYTRDVPVVDELSAASLLKNRARGNSRRGVRAAGRAFTGAFINLAPNGYFHVFKRHGRARLPVDVLKIPIKKEAQEFTEKLSQEGMRVQFRRNLQHDLNRRLQKLKVK